MDILEPVSGSSLEIAQQAISSVDPDAASEKVMDRNTPEVDDDREALVKDWVKKVQGAKKFFEKDFKKMREDMAFARGRQWGENDTDNDDKYIANLTQRHIQNRVAALYAKNPKAVAKPRKRLDFSIWDGEQSSIAEAMQIVQMAQAAGQMPPPEAIGLLQELEAVKTKRHQLQKIGQTAEIMYQYYMDEAEPNFKLQAKQMIRRVITTGVGYVKLGFHRAMEKSPDVTTKIADLSARMAVLEQLSADVADGEISESQAEFEQLELTLKALQSEPEVLISEGLIFDFPRSTSIIVDPNCTCLKGFIGAGWIAHEFMFTKDEIKRIYGVDVGSNAKSYQFPYSGAEMNGGNSGGANPTEKVDKFAVWEIQDKVNGLVLTVCDGYKDFLEEPSSPKVKLQRFFNVFSLSFNDVEDDMSIYPPSDVRLMRSMQIEFNRSREGLREHRIANRPAYGAPKGVLEDEEANKLISHAPNELIEFNVPRETDMRSVIQPLQKAPIDPSVYDTAMIFDDVQKVVGAQQADFGGVSGVAATEVSVAEGARMATISSNIDDLDDMLTQLARCAGEIMLREISPETARKIAGDGAMWPELTGQEIADEIYLQIAAGSSGRPNKAQEIANFERMAPTLLQIPSISPTWLAKQAIMRMDDTLDIDDAIMEGMPSMVAMNAAMRPSTGNPANDPAQQGGAQQSSGGHNQGQAPSPQDAQTGGGQF